MALPHSVEYSKSSQATCYGQMCGGTTINLGELRYGLAEATEWGDRVKWWHWGCVTTEMLGRLRMLPTLAAGVAGFADLRAGDCLRVQRAVKLGSVSAEDLTKSTSLRSLNGGALPTSQPSSSTVSWSTMPPPTHTPLKRKHGALAVSPSQSRALLLSGSQMPSASQGDVIDIDHDESPDNHEEEDINELYCVMRSTVVGIQYYTGMVGPGEEVTLRREPTNKYDRNAIQVLNIAQSQIGHIPKNFAVKMAPLMDKKVIHVEGVVLDGNLGGRRTGQYSLNVTLKFFALASKRDTIEPLLVWATPGQKGFPSRSAGSSVSAVHQVPGASQGHGTPAGSSHGAGTGYAGAGTSYPAGYSASRTVYPTPSQRTAGGQPGARAGPTISPAELASQQAALRKQQLALQQAAELREVLAGLEKVNDEGRRSSLLDSLFGIEDILSLPEHPNPPSVNTGELKNNLLKHQSQALQWAMAKEYPKLPTSEKDKPVQFWQYQKNGAQAYYYNIATKTPHANPVLNRGALCADSMGLGKTLTMLALIIATKPDVPTDFSISTLIVVPLSVLSNWETQFKEHCTPGTISTCVYYGAGRSMTPLSLKKHDIVLTTYNVVVSEFAAFEKNAPGAEPSKKKQKTSDKTSLFQVRWKRIILDEGHNIRNSKTKMAKSVCELVAQRRWVLTGTPIINSPKDLGSIVKFLQICSPLDKEEYFNRLVIRPLKNGEPGGAELMRAVMTQICIRRTKEMKDAQGNPLIKLPPVEVTLVTVALNPKARAMYDELDELARSRIEADVAANGLTMAVRTNALSMLTRMRQLALHPALVPANYLEQLRQSMDDTNHAQPTTLTPEDRVRLQRILAQRVEDSEECPICFNALAEDPMITSCAHCYCLACIMEVLARDPRCPMDRRPIREADLVEMPPPTELTQASVREVEDEDGLDGKSDKINQLIHLLRLTPPTEKSLVFSQFTGFLDKIAEELEEAGITYERFDGQMSAQRRRDTIERFCVPIKDDDVPLAPSQDHSTDVVSSTGRPVRRARSNFKVSSDVIDVDASDDGSDFENSGGEGDDSFAEDDDVIDATPKKKGKGKGKAKAPATTRIASRMAHGVNSKVMLISLKAGALGLNLTVANNVYLMDPWWQEGIESQAIDRCNRIGQKKPVHVYQLVAENTVESKVLDIQERKKKMIQEAFSGIKSNETQRQKKEARLQDLIELFGLRQQVATQEA